jgi:hypothetical protein
MDASEIKKPLSAILRDVVDGDAERVCVSDLMEHFGGSAMGAILLIFGLACLLPLPPGSTTILGAPLMLLAPQLAFGRQSPWIPKSLWTRSIAVSDLRRGLPKVLKWLERMEAVSRPRLTFLFGSIGRRMIGLVCSVLALVLILPIPAGNFVPAISVSLLSLSLLQRDGYLALAGYAAAAASAAILVLAFGLIRSVLLHLITVLWGA